MLRASNCCTLDSPCSNCKVKLVKFAGKAESSGPASVLMLPKAIVRTLSLAYQRASARLRVEADMHVVAVELMPRAAPS